MATVPDRPRRLCASLVGCVLFAGLLASVSDAAAGVPLLRKIKQAMSQSHDTDGSELTAPPLLWSLIGKSLVQELNRHPDDTAYSLESAVHRLDHDVHALDGMQDVPEIEPTVLALGATHGRLAFAVALNWGPSGSFFVIGEKKRGRFALLWDVQEIAASHFESRDELGRWAYRSQGYHDGPLGSQISALPPSASGRPRFLVEAQAHPSMGGDWPVQIGVWEWTGHKAQPQFLQICTQGYESEPLVFADDVITIGTKEQPRAYFSCGSCDEPRGVWKLRITPEGVVDLGHSFVDTELAAADELFARVLKHEDTADIAAPGVDDALREAIDDESSDFIGMMGGWNVEDRGKAHVLDFQADGTRPVTFTMVKRDDGGWFFESVVVHQLDDAPEEAATLP